MELLADLTAAFWRVGNDHIVNLAGMRARENSLLVLILRKARVGHKPHGTGAWSILSAAHEIGNSCGGRE